MTNQCQNCKYYQNSICIVPIWADGIFYGGQVTKPENTCALFEERETLVTMDEVEA